jgi:hypothetical protein
MKNNIITGKTTGGGVAITGAPTPGIQAGYIQGSFASVPALDSKGLPISNEDLCGVKSGLNAFSIQNGNATSASNTTSGPATSIAINEGTITGRAAELAALGGGQAPTPAAIAADKDCTKAGPTAP